MPPIESTPFVRIPLTQGKATLISPEDAERVAPYRWYAHWNGSKWYAMSHDASLGTSPVSLHRFLTNAPTGVPIDHRNGNGFDNRRGNLRLATPTTNQANKVKQRNNSSGYIGVSFNKASRKWVAYASRSNKVVYLGSFENAEAAARIRDEFVKQLHGEFARLNFT